jgi:hypothetical protein
MIQPRKPTTGYVSVTRSSTLAVIDVLSSVRSQLQRVLGGSRDDSSPRRNVRKYKGDKERRWSGR